MLLLLSVDYSPKDIRSRMVATIMAGYAIGGIVVALLSIFFIPTFGWQYVFIFGALPLVFLPFLSKSLPDTVGSHLSRKEDSKVKAILVKIDPFYKPSENEQLVMNPVKRTSSPITSLFVENRALCNDHVLDHFFSCLLL